MQTRRPGASSLRSSFGRRVRYLRRLRVLTQEQLAETIGVSVNFLSSIERGINAPSFENLERLANALEVEVHELFIFSKQRPAE